MLGIVLVLLALWLWSPPASQPVRRRPGTGRPVRSWGRRRVDPAARDLAEGARLVREMASLLRSGQDLDAALQNLAMLERDDPVTGQALAALRMHRQMPWAAGAEVSGRLARQPTPLARQLQLCVQICADSGAPLAEVLDHLADDLEANLDARRGFEVAMAGPRATTRLLTWLPAVGLGGSLLFGIDVTAALTSSPLGRAALVAGIVLWLANRWWCRWLLRRCTQRAVG